MLGGIGGRPPDDVDAALAQVVDRLLLGRVQVAGRDDVGAAALQGQEQGRGLRLEVDPGPDPHALERPRALELVARLLQQPRAAGHPLEPRQDASSCRFAAIDTFGAQA